MSKFATMVRFSCFNAHIHSQKSKEINEPSVKEMNKTLQVSSQIQVSKLSSKASSLDSLLLDAQINTEISGSTKDFPSSVFVEGGWKPEEFSGKLDIENETGVCQKGLLKKSQSLASALCHEGRVLCNNDTEYEMVRGFSSDSIDQNVLVGPDGDNELEGSATNQQGNAPQSESVQLSSDIFNNKSIFSIGDLQHSDKEEPENSEIMLSGEGANESGNHTPPTLQTITKSSSLPNIDQSLLSSDACSYNRMATRSRSSEDLHVLCMRCKEVSLNEVCVRLIQEHERNDNVCKTEKVNFESLLDDGYDTYNYSASAKDWIIPVADEVTLGKRCQGESIQQDNELQGKDFKMKRIEEWVTDLQHCSPLEESDEISDSVHPLNRDSTVASGLTAMKRDNKVTPGMEAAKRYISSLSASATTAQLSNHGLAVIPFLGAFVSLRVLNLSGNSIVRVAAGSLPRGLHALNLSKNNISTIEGLRELTRLRVLDLSYNRIFRIGHGLASCSSLKELYLAGNKISEVEGLHRLLKLTVLDLRFNKISTSKCLGQLAANYSSLQAISLEGNPAQKNVGDEQVKKYLQSLLPHLVYFNRQPIKVSTLKDAADRSVRLGINAHQFDRGLRLDNKAARKGSHGLGGTRPTSSSTQGRKIHGLISPKRSKGKHVRLPPSGTKVTANNPQHYFDIGSKLLNFSSELAMRRSRSEGTLGAL